MLMKLFLFFCLYSLILRNYFLFGERFMDQLGSGHANFLFKTVYLCFQTSCIIFPRTDQTRHPKILGFYFIGPSWIALPQFMNTFHHFCNSLPKSLSTISKRWYISLQRFLLIIMLFRVSFEGLGRFGRFMISVFHFEVMNILESHYYEKYYSFSNFKW